VDAEVELVRVDAGVVHAHVAQEAAGHDRPDAQAAQQQVEIGGEERAVAALADEMLARPRPQRRDELGARGALDAVLGLVAVELAADVDAPRPVELLREDHRRPASARSGDQAGHARESRLRAAGPRPAGLDHRQEVDLRIDDQQRGAGHAGAADR